MRVLIIGCGYVGLPFAENLSRQGHEVFGMRRGPFLDSALKESGIRPLVGDITKPASLETYPANWDWVVNCVSAGAAAVSDYRTVYLEGTRNLLAWLERNPPRKFVYTSSTGVYGQTDGSTVDETSPAQPGTATGDILVETEALLTEAKRTDGFPAVILRVAGIYGPGRGYWFRQFLKGEARLESDGSRILNMIHRDDVGGAIEAALCRGEPGEIYNAVDDEPVTQNEFFAWLSAKLGKPMLTAVDDSPQAVTLRRFTNKRVSNRKLRTKLEWQPVYPSFREGYAEEIAAAAQKAQAART